MSEASSFMNSCLCFSIQSTLVCEVMLDSKHDSHQVPNYSFILVAILSFVMIAKPVTGVRCTMKLLVS